jgi:hypothetical protein
LRQQKKIVAITSHFFKFQAQAAIKTLISSPTCPLSRFLESLKSDLIPNLCLEFEKMAGNSHYFFVLAKTGFIFCKIPKVFLRYWIKSSFVDLDGWKNGWFWFVWSGF